MPAAGSPRPASPESGKGSVVGPTGVSTPNEPLVRPASRLVMSHDPVRLCLTTLISNSGRGRANGILDFGFPILDWPGFASQNPNRESKITPLALQPVHAVQ